MYNAGVIFFSPTPAVRQVLQRWRDLCATVGAKWEHATDQPFLTLAMEQLGFVPYPLSPSYNYRSLGEHAVGNIRIWHSHFPVPSDVNAFEDAWPGRRFRDGIRQTADSPAPERVSQLPQGMVQLALSQIGRRRRPQKLRSIVRKVVKVQRKKNSRAANEALFGYVGIAASLERDESYFAEALHYHLGLLHAHAGEPEQMAWHMHRSRTMPTGEEDQLLSDHVNISKVLRNKVRRDRTEFASDPDFLHASFRKRDAHSNVGAGD